MYKAIRKAISFETQKLEEYTYWQSVSPTERVAAGLALSKESYRQKGLYTDGQELDRTIVSLRAATNLAANT